jgi:hypothetical protein
MQNCMTSVAAADARDLRINMDEAIDVVQADASVHFGNLKHELETSWNYYLGKLMADAGLLDDDDEEQQPETKVARIEPDGPVYEGDLFEGFDFDLDFDSDIEFESDPELDAAILSHSACPLADDSRGPDLGVVDEACSKGHPSTPDLPC